jgi:hypothetical protein
VDGGGVGGGGGGVGQEGVEEDPVPAKSVKVVGTVWSEVTCTDGRTYFYNEESEVRVCGGGGGRVWVHAGLEHCLNSLNIA